MPLPFVAARGNRGGTFAAAPAAPAAGAPTVTRESDLLAWWKFDETAGTNAADSVGGNAMTLAADSSFVAGKNGYAVDMDGSGDYIASSAGPTEAGDCTISWWVNCDVIGAMKGMVATTNYFTAGYDGNFSLRHTTGGDVFIVHTNNASGYLTHNWDTNMSTGAWYHVALVLDVSEETVNCWVNNTDYGSYATGGRTFENMSAGLLFGMFLQTGGGPYNAFNGKVDDLRVYGEALADSDIALLYGSGNGDWP